jgi:hypothetical protein
LALLACALIALLGLPPLLILAFVWGLIALGIWPWAAYLIAAALALVMAAGLAVAGRASLKKGAASFGRITAMIKESFSAIKGEPVDTAQPGPTAPASNTAPRTSSVTGRRAESPED